MDDHLEVQTVGIRDIDVVDFDYPAWHTQYDTIDRVSASSLQVVGDVAVELIRREGRDSRFAFFPPLKAPPCTSRVIRRSPHRLTVPPCLHPKLAPCCCFWRWRCSARAFGISSRGRASLPVRSNCWARCLPPPPALSGIAPCGRAGPLVPPREST